MLLLLPLCCLLLPPALGWSSPLRNHYRGLQQHSSTLHPKTDAQELQRINMQLSRKLAELEEKVEAYVSVNISAESRAEKETRTAAIFKMVMLEILRLVAKEEEDRTELLARMLR
jgi:hypothetical protein